MDPTAVGCTDRSLHNIDEGCDVMIGDLLTREHRGDEGGVDRRSAPATDLGRGARHQSEFGVALGGEQLNFEPSREASLIAPQSGHLGCLVPIDHRSSPQIT